jgi:tetratricopeptide (TPR) repeat protein
MPRHRILWVISLLLSLIFILPNVTFSAQEQRLALLIGNSNYAHGGSLPNPVNDIRAMTKVLEGLGFTVMKYENCSQKSMKRAMDKFGRQLKGKDVGLFFYSGHGFQVNGHNYLLPVDAKLDGENDAEYDCVRADRVLAKMETAGSRTNIVILDACRDNPFTRSWRRGTEGSGLAFMNAPSGSLIAYSTAPGKTALDGRRKNSPYTSALLQHIRTPNITVLEMFQGVRSTVITRTGGKQTPWESTSLRGNFYFNEERKIAVEQQKEQGTRTNGKLFVVTEPKDARVRVLNIKPRFYQGMDLDPGEYHIEISASGYKTKKGWVELTAGEDKSISIQLVPVDPKDAWAYYNRGDAHTKLKQYIKAIQSYGKAIELDPNDTWTYYSRGNAYFYLKQYIKAIQDYDKAIELDPKDSGLYYDRGNAYFYLKQYIKAIQDYDKAIELDPKDSGVYYNRGFAYAMLKQHIKAIQSYDKAIELDPKNAKYYTERGSAYAKLKQYIKSIQDYDKAIELDPKDALTYHNRGVSYLILNRRNQGCADFKKACDLGDCDGLEQNIKQGYCR